jgi:putative ABC transport system permease protein
MQEALVRRRLTFLHEPSRDAETELLRGGDVVLASESAASRLRVTVGDKVTIPGRIDFLQATVAAIVRDYTTDQGVFFVSEPMFERLYGAPSFATLGLYLRQGCGLDTVSEEVHRVVPGFSGSIHSAHSLRKEVLRIFDDTFTITYVLQAVCLAIAAVTVFNALAMLLQEKERHIGMLRVLGASRDTVLRTVSIEALILGVLGSAVGIVAGLAIALQLSGPINRVFFGWTVPLVV